MILMALDAPKEALLTYSHTLDVLTDRADDVLQVAGGAGGAAGSLVSGYLWTGLGPQAMYLMAAAVCLCAAGMVLFGVRDIPES